MQDRLRRKTGNQYPEQKNQAWKFQIRNSSPSNKSAEHWIMLCAIDTMVITLEFLFGIASAGLYAITINSNRWLWNLYGKCGGFQAINLPFQNLRSNLWSVLLVYSTLFDQETLQRQQTAKNPTLMKTFEIDIVRFLNEHVKYSQFKYRSW